MINCNESPYGHPCFVELLIMNWKPEIHKTIIEELTLKFEDHCVQSSSAHRWYIVPKEGGLYNEGFENRLEVLRNRLYYDLRLEAPTKTYLKVTWEDIPDEKAKKNIKKYYM